MLKHQLSNKRHIEHRGSATHARASGPSRSTTFINSFTLPFFLLSFSLSSHWWVEDMASRKREGNYWKDIWQIVFVFKYKPKHILSLVLKYTYRKGCLFLRVCMSVYVCLHSCVRVLRSRVSIQCVRVQGSVCMCPSSVFVCVCLCLCGWTTMLTNVVQAKAEWTLPPLFFSAAVPLWPPSGQSGGRGSRK